MHLRRVRAKTASGPKLYTQLVQSYRRSDGKTAQKVVASLGVLEDQAYDNLKAAFEASRRGRRVIVLPDSAPSELVAPRAAETLQFLDLAVLYHLWHREGLDRLLRDALGQRRSSAAVIEALVLQRCTVPDSKLAAVRWYPRTALPKILGLPADKFNNSRIHRDLGYLEAAKPALAGRIARTYAKREGGFACLFLDVSDTWFEGNGPEIARKAKTKEGLIKRKIAIVLLCNERGYPLRWEVCDGKAADINLMKDVLRKVGKTEWLGDTPLVCDRAMGKPSAIADMLTSKVRFLTALPKTEFLPFGAELPCESFSDSELGFQYKDKQEAIDEAAQRASKAGMRKIQEDIFLLDLGKLTRTISSTSFKALKDRDTRGEPATAMAMRVAQEVAEAVAEGASLAEAAKAQHLGRSLVSKYKVLLGLAPDLQRRVRQGQAASHPLSALLSIAALGDTQTQHERFEQLVRTTPRASSTTATAPADNEETMPKEVTVRAVAYFNPVLFVDKRRTATRVRSQIEEFVENLNKKARTNPTRYPEQSLVAAVREELKSHDLLTAFSVTPDHLEQDGRTVPQLKLMLDQRRWHERRRFDGFSVLVGHPDLPHGPEELIRLYRSKNCVEQDFQTIKSVVELRPVHHRQDLKVCAHVSLCVLALLLQRVLERRLASTRLSTITAPSAVEQLTSCRLNKFEAGDQSTYTTTRPDPDQRRLLEALHCDFLANDLFLAEELQPAS